jgi:predicted RND superfamily exporter protein
LAASLVLTAAAAIGARQLTLASDYRVFFSPDNPDLLAFDALEDIYTKNDNILFTIRPRDGEVFTEPTLEAVRAITEDAWQIPYSTRVDAITNFQHTWAKGDELVVEDLVPQGAITPDVVERARKVSLLEPMLAGKVISHDGGTTGVNVRVALPGESSEELRAAVSYARELEARYRVEYPELEIHTAGLSMLNAAFAESPERDLPFVMPLMFGALTVAVIFFLRSGSGAAATLLVIGSSVAVAVGLAGHLRLQFDPVSASAPTIILTLAVADSVHILVSFLQALRKGKTRHDALVEAMDVNAQPVFLTSITTIVGFLSLNFGDSPPFRLLGNVTAFGVLVAWISSMTLLPAVVAILPTRARGRFALGEILGERLGDLIARRYRAVLTGMAVVTLVFVGAIQTLRINDVYFEYFDESLEFRQASDFTMDHLTGIQVSSFSLDSGETQGVTDPEYLARVDAFAEWLRSRPGVVHVSSFSDVMKRLNMNMHGDDPEFYRLPESRQLGAQYLLLYELSLPYGLDVNDQIDIDKSSLRTDATFGNVDTATMQREARLAGEWLREHGTPSMARAAAVGPALMFAKITERNIRSMLVGTALGFGTIALILMVALKSFRLGVVSLAPNVLPAALAFGVWAILVGELGFAVSVVAGLSIGIIVDDTVHFLSKYHRARREMSAEDAVRCAFRNVGSAILGTTFIVSVGFAMLGLSTFRVTSYMGLLTSLTVVCALVTDFLLLPALLVALDRRTAGVKALKPALEPAPV